MIALSTGLVVAGAIIALAADVWEWRGQRRAWLLLGGLIPLVLAASALTGGPTPDVMVAAIVTPLAAGMVLSLIAGR